MKKTYNFSSHKKPLVAGAIVSVVTAPLVRDFIVGILKSIFD